MKFAEFLAKIRSYKKGYVAAATAYTNCIEIWLLI